MLKALAILFLGAGHMAFADEPLTAGDGAVWTVQKEARASSGPSRVTILHVLRAGREVARFVESTALQSNPQMTLNTTFAFRLGAGGVPVATETKVVHAWRDDGKGGTEETEETTTVEHIWQGTTFKPGTPQLRRSKKPIGDP